MYRTASILSTQRNERAFVFHTLSHVQWLQVILFKSKETIMFKASEFQRMY